VQLERSARDVTFSLLAHNRARLRHTVGVASRARLAAATVEPVDADVLVAAAWLHDIGYSEKVRRSGFHPLDGARHLERTGWPPRLCGLVAFHSGAAFVAAEIGLGNALADFIDEQGLVQDALTFADQTTAPTGEAVAFERRIEDMLQRHGPDSPNARVHIAREPYLRAAVQRVQSRLDARGRLAPHEEEAYPGRHRRE